GGVAHFRPRGPRFDGHRLEHLGGQDDGDAAGTRPARDVFLGARHRFLRHLETQIAASHHDRIAHTEDLVEVLERFRPRQLRHDRRVVAVRGAGQHPHSPQIGGGLDEAQGHQIHAEQEAELQIVDVFRRHGRRGKHHAGRVDALVLAERAALHDRRSNVGPVRVFDAQFDQTVREQQAIARFDALGETGEGRRDVPGTADAIAGRNDERIASRERNGPSALEEPGPDLRSREILQDGHVASGSIGGAPDACDGCRVGLMRSMGKVEPDDVDTSLDHRVEHLVGTARGTNSGDDLRVSHTIRFFIMGQIVPDAVERYLAGLNHLVDPVLAQVAEDGARQELPLVDAEVGALLHVLASSLGANRILEIGTAIGYSGIWLASAIPKGGMLITIELNQERAATARENFAKAGLSDRVSVMVGDAGLLVTKVSGPFDLIFQDGSKKLYVPLLDRLVDRLRPGGLLVTDNVLWDGDVVPGFNEKKRNDPEDTAAIVEYNQRINSHPRLMTATVPLRDGVAISVKRSDRS